MSAVESDRVVLARLVDTSEIVRYADTNQYWREWPEPKLWRNVQITMTKAAALTVVLCQVLYPKQRGAAVFDRKVRQFQALWATDQPYVREQAASDE